MIVAPASGSVGDTTAPSTNAAAHESPGISACAAAATATMVASTSPIEVRAMGRRLARRSARLAKNAAP